MNVLLRIDTILGKTAERGDERELFHHDRNQTKESSQSQSRQFFHPTATLRESRYVEHFEPELQHVFAVEVLGAVGCD